jgi:serine protease Do
VRDVDELRFLLRDVPLGTKISLDLQRSDGTVHVHITPVALTPEHAMVAFQTATGLKLAEVSAAEARQAGIEAPRGLVSVDGVDRNSAGFRAGIRRGDVVVAVNSAEIDTLKDFQKALAQARRGGAATLLVQRGYRLFELQLDLG